MNSLSRHCCLWMCGMLLLAGCGGADDQPTLGTVSGKVTMDGAPLPNVWVMFNPKSGRTSLGRTDEDGYYELQYLEGTEGANLGPHQVVIQAYAEDELYELQQSSPTPVKEPIPAKYNSKTTLSAEVKEGDNDIPFSLESK